MLFRSGLVQPVDVGYNKAFKAKVRSQFNDWLLQQDPDVPIAKTTRRQVIEWILAAERDVSAESAPTIRRSMVPDGLIVTVSAAPGKVSRFIVVSGSPIILMPLSAMLTSDIFILKLMESFDAASTCIVAFMVEFTFVT